MGLESGNQLLKDFMEAIASPRVKTGKKLYTGVDLGTAYIVLAVVDEDGIPVAGAMEFAQVVRDGLVVDYTGAVRIVRKLKAEIEEAIGEELGEAAVAYPPGTGPKDARAIMYVAEAAGFSVIGSIDEPTAANAVLGIEDGAVVDIGGGTTGTAIFQGGEVVYVADDPTGGTQFTLVVAGGMKITFEEAEKLKKDPELLEQITPMIRPVMEKVASIIDRHIANHRVDVIYLVGGTSCNPHIEGIVEGWIGTRVEKPANPFLVTPLGIAFFAKNFAAQQAAV